MSRQIPCHAAGLTLRAECGSDCGTFCINDNWMGVIADGTAARFDRLGRRP